LVRDDELTTSTQLPRKNIPTSSEVRLHFLPSFLAQYTSFALHHPLFIPTAVLRTRSSSSSCGAHRSRVLDQRRPQVPPSPLRIHETTDLLQPRQSQLRTPIEHAQSLAYSITTIPDYTAVLSSSIRPTKTFDLFNLHCLHILKPKYLSNCGWRTSNSCSPV
jgi:hypothetical protein